MRAAWLVVAVACSSKSNAPVEQKAASQTGMPPSAPRIEPRPVPEPPPIRDARLRTTVDLRPLSQACRADADCMLVDVSPCNRCSCADVAVSKSAERAFEDAAAAIPCKDVQIAPCVDCLAVVPVCVEGACTTRSTEPIPQGGECQTDHDCVVSCVEPGKCCPDVVCETTIARAKALKTVEDNRGRCTPEALAQCTRPETSEYIQPRCRRGTCFGEFLTR